MGLCRGLPHQAGTHSKNPQCLVDSQAQAQAQGSHRRDAVVAATERRVPCAALQAAVQSHVAPGPRLELLLQPPGPASKHSPGAPGKSVCRHFNGVSSVQGPADMPRELFPANSTPQWRPAAAPGPSALSKCSLTSCTLALSPRQSPSPLPTSCSRPPHCSWLLCLQASPISLYLLRPQLSPTGRGKWVDGADACADGGQPRTCLTPTSSLPSGFPRKPGTLPGLGGAAQPWQALSSHMLDRAQTPPEREEHVRGAPPPTPALLKRFTCYTSHPPATR